MFRSFRLVEVLEVDAFYVDREPLGKVSHASYDMHTGGYRMGN